MALNQPISPSRGNADVVVCMIVTGHGHTNVEERMGAVLECGTNSWFIDRLGRCGGIDYASTHAVYHRKSAWHTCRTLSFVQRMYLRELLKVLPPPGKGTVVVVDKAGKTIATNQN